MNSEKYIGLDLSVSDLLFERADFHGSYPASFKIQRLRGNFQGTNLIPLKPGHAGV